MEGDAEMRKVTNSGAFGSFITQQIVENIIQAGIMSGLSKVAAGGVLGTLGVTVISQLGWFIVLQTVGWMGGGKIAIFGIAGHGSLGGAITGLGGTAIGGLLAISELAQVRGIFREERVSEISCFPNDHFAACSSQMQR